MATFSLKPASEGADNIEGTEASDLAVAVNATLNAGDIVDLKGGSDIVRSAVDASLVANVADRHDFSGFTFLGVETFEIVNDSTLANGVRYDMSSSPGIQTFRITNSSATTTIDQIASMAAFELDNYTNPGNANVNIGFRANVLSGANDTVTITVNDTDVQNLDVGIANNGNPLDPINSGIETLRINITGGDSFINDIDSGASRIEFNGDGNLFVDDQLDQSATTVISTGSGDRDLVLGDNGVTYQGADGQDIIYGGLGSDIINTADGDDIVFASAGNDTINGGGGNNFVVTGSGTNSVTTFSGNDTIFAQGTNDFIDSGAGTDVIDISATTIGSRTTIIAGDGSDRIDAGDRFDASNNANGDIANMGTGFDILQVTNGLNDAQFALATNLEALAVTQGVTTNLGLTAQAAGIDVVYFASANVNDVLNASTFTQDLGVSNGQEYGGQGLGGDDTATTGSGADAFYWRGNNALTDADNLNAGAQSTANAAGTADGLYLQGDTTITAASGIRGFEYIALETSRNSIYANLIGDSGAQYNIALSDLQAPTGNGQLLINGTSLQGDTDGAGPLVMETANISTVAVTAFQSVILTGLGNDVVNSGVMGDIIATAGGNDIVNAGGGNDVIDTGLGDDTVDLQAGNNILTDGGGNNKITLGTGNDLLLLGAGNDTVVGGANLNSLDSIPGFGSGNDVLRVFGRNYSDADFTGVGGGLETLELGSRVGDVGAFAGDEAFTFVLGAEVQKTNVTTVVANGAGASNIDASAITRGLTFDLSAGGDDVLLSTQGNDLVIAGVGIQSVTGGQGDDVLRVDGNEFAQNDSFFGGAGNDTFQMDNTGGGVFAFVNLTNVRDVENFVLRANGDRLPGVDSDFNYLNFSNAPVNSVNTLTTINVDFSALTDADDIARVDLANTLTDPDYAFNITGSSTSTIVVKLNTGVNNNINFQGGSGVDLFAVDGGDLGATTVFNGGAGEDRIIQIGGVITDDSYVSVRNVEVLEGLNVVNATLGEQAMLSGLNLIQGTGSNDQVTLDPAFTSALRVEIESGNDTVNGGVASAALTVAALDFQFNTSDVLIGGTSAGDVLEVTAANGTADLTATTGFETINVVGDFNSAASTGSTIVVDTAAGDVAGGIQTISTSGFGATDVFRLGGDAATARLVVSSQDGNDVIRTGSGNDQINAGNGNNQVSSGMGNDLITTGTGNDLIQSGEGNDVVNAGAGADVVDGGAGNDLLNGEGGSDNLRGGLGSDTINGGAGMDQIEGGAGVDVLTGGADADIFFYKNVSDSAGTLGRDTITDFQSGVDKIDISDLLGTAPGVTSIAFLGNFANFADAQGAITDGDGVIDVVFQQDSGILWFDVNDDGTLNADDIQIVLQGVGSVTGADVGAGAFTPGGAAVTPYDTFDASFVSVSVVP